MVSVLNIKLRHFKVVLAFWKVLAAETVVPGTRRPLWISLVRENGLVPAPPVQQGSSSWAVLAERGPLFKK